LAQLLVDSFKDVMTVKELKSALKNLPKGSDAYDSAYHAAMDRIFAQGKGSREKAQKILAWILCAYRPLSTYELLHALAVEPGDTDFDEDNMMETEQLLAICAGLVTIDEQSDNVRFIHYTTQEYLQRNQQVWLPKANAEIARTCIAYLSIDDFAVGPCSSREDYDRRLKKFTLLNYATTYWGPHTNSLIGQGCIPGASEALIEAQALLLDTKCLSTASQALFMSNMWSYLGVDVEELGKGFSGCHWLGRFGLLLLLKEWTSRQYELDQSDFSGRTPLSWAAGNGHEAVVKLLMESDNVDVDSRDKSGRTPLSWAAENGEEVMVKLLLETGKVDVDSKDKYGQTPLARAAAKGQEAVVTLLVKTGKVDVDSKDEHGRTPLARATENGQEAVVKQLIRSDKVDVDSKNSYGQTPLSRAAWKGHEVIVKLLIETGKVVVDFKKWGGQTPLSLAAWYGREAVVKLLIGCDEVDVDSQDEQGRTPLSWAAVNGREAVVKLLIGTGKVDVDSKDKSGRTPLSWAAWNGREVIVELLIGTGEVNVDSKDDYGRTPLSRAAENGHEPMVELFLKELVRSHLQSGRCESPVRNVTCNENHSMPKSEITRSTGLDTVDIYGRTPLMWAAMRGHISLIRTFWPSSLGPASSVITLKDTLGCSFIHLFAIGGCFEGICLLLDAGIDINTTDSQGWTPLYWAAYCNHENLVSLLLERQADRSLKNSRVWSAHRIALSIGADNILEIHKHSLVGGDDQTSRIAQRFDAYCDVCQQVSLLSLSSSIPKSCVVLIFFKALLGIRYHCKSCYDFDLCFRCILDVSMIHPQHQFDSEEKFA
jgi:ankyrin repeat protein